MVQLVADDNSVLAVHVYGKRQIEPPRLWRQRFAISLVVAKLHPIVVFLHNHDSPLAVQRNIREARELSHIESIGAECTAVSVNITDTDLTVSAVGYDNPALRVYNDSPGGGKLPQIRGVLTKFAEVLQFNVGLGESRFGKVARANQDCQEQAACSGNPFR